MTRPHTGAETEKIRRSAAASLVSENQLAMWGGVGAMLGMLLAFALQHMTFRTETVPPPTQTIHSNL